MPTTTLIISDANETRELSLDTRGVTIGRNEDCDIVLPSPHVSRMHARLYQDPFRRWIIEDLQSHNGVYVGGEKVEAYALLPGDKIRIPPYTLTLSEGNPDATMEFDLPKDINMLGAETVDEVVLSKVLEEKPLIRQLNLMTEELLKIGNLPDLYAEACRQLAFAMDSLTVIVRIPCRGDDFRKHLKVLACQAGRDESGQSELILANMVLSRRILNTVRQQQTTVMGRSSPNDGSDMVLTVVDEHQPRLVFAVPVSDPGDTIDILYIDLREEQSPENMIEFIEAVGRQVNFARKGLQFAQAKAEKLLLEQQLSYARDIQSKLIPAAPEGLEGIELAVSYQPAMWVGGDYCDLWQREDGQLAFTIGDVAGKGLAAALVMSNLHAVLRTTMRYCNDLGQVMGAVNDHIISSTPYELFVTLFIGVFSPRTGQLTYVNAGHIPPLQIIRGQQAIDLGKPSNPVAGIVEHDYLVQQEQLAPGNGLIVVTDGITESQSPAEEEFGIHGLKNTVTQCADTSAATVLDNVLSDAVNFRQSRPQQDDTTVMVLFNRSHGD